jgi:uncharacterized tellurite resistance protein B-like protein
MLDSIRSFFSRRMQLDAGAAAAAEAAGDAAADEQYRLQVAACALLLELAHADDEFTLAERDHIEAVLRRHFALDEETARELLRLAEAERESAIDLYQFTNLVRNSYDLGQKTVLAEVMWGLVMSDGEVARDEAYMLRKIANLLDLQPGYLAAARKQAQSR